MKNRVYLLLTTLLLTGCLSNQPTIKSSESPPSNQPTVKSSELPQVDQASGVKAKFEAQVKEDTAKLGQSLSHPITQGTNVYYAKYDGSTEIDIRKTDSLVTPYQGVAKYGIDWYCNEQKTSGSMAVVATYAYQNEAWVFKSAVRIVDGLPDNDPGSVGGSAWANGLYH